MLNFLFNSIITNGAVSGTSFFICTLASLILGALIAGIYRLTEKSSKSFLITLLILPAVIQMVIMLVNGNIGAGVAVAGAFSLVRFRSVPGNGKEISTIFLTMAVGLATGMGYILAATTFALVISLVSFLARMDEGSAKFVMIDFPLSDVVTETAQSFRSRAQLAEKSFDIDVEPMINFFGDEKAIRQLVGILLDNAIKYSNDNGRIKICLSRQNHKIDLSVYNTADLIKEEDLPRIFDRFYRSDASRNSENGGYGIGLSLAQAIVNAHKGKIQAQSKDGRSMIIKVTLPLKTAGKIDPV